MLEREGSIVGVFPSCVLCITRSNLRFSSDSARGTIGKPDLAFSLKMFSMGVGIGGGSWTRSHIEFEFYRSVDAH